MNIDWDAIAEEADHSVRGILAELLARADEITNLVVVFHDTIDAQHTWQSTSSVAMTISMLALSQWCELEAAASGE